LKVFIDRNLYLWYYLTMTDFEPKQTIPQDQTEVTVGPEVRAEAVATLGSAFHEDWRKTRLNEDGSFEPRVKTTKDEAWIEAHGTDQVDIANTDFENLPSDWQAENKAAAEVIVNVFEAHNGQVGLDNPATRTNIGETVHAAWLSRNEWAKGGDLDVPFADLPVEEQDKDLNQVVVAQRVFTHEQ
jgi:hypothetical protein